MLSWGRFGGVARAPRFGAIALGLIALGLIALGLVALGLVASAAMPAPARAETLRFLTHRLAPFTTGGSEAPRGLAIDIVTELMRRTGDQGPIEVTSFSRLLEALELDTHAVGFVIARTPEREFKMGWVGPLTVSGVYVYKKAGSPVRVRTLDELRTLDVVAVQKGNADDEYLTRLGFANLSHSYQQVETLGLVRNGRAAATPMSELVFPSLVAEAGLRRSDFERTALKLYDSKLYLGFSRHIGARVIDAWSAALASLKASGRYAEIVGAYHATD